jgi:hypothetical protein
MSPSKFEAAAISMVTMFRKRLRTLSIHTSARIGSSRSLCGAWIEYDDLGKVLAHTGPLPRPQRIAAQGAI